MNFFSCWSSQCPNFGHCFSWWWNSCTLRLLVGLQKALKCATDLENPRGQCASVGNLGFLLYKRKKYEVAKACMIRWQLDLFNITSLISFPVLHHQTALRTHMLGSICLRGLQLWSHYLKRGKKTPQKLNLSTDQQHYAAGTSKFAGSYISCLE